eukprot:g32591.t1
MVKPAFSADVMELYAVELLCCQLPAATIGISTPFDRVTLGTAVATGQATAKSSDRMAEGPGARMDRDGLDLDSYEHRAS